MKESAINYWINNKNKKRYIVLHSNIVNATNAQDGQKMYLYCCANNDDVPHVRSEEEFLEKFTKE